MYDKCYFCLDQLPKLKKESTASFFVNFGRSRGTKEPTYITVSSYLIALIMLHFDLIYFIRFNHIYYPWEPVIYFTCATLSPEARAV